MDSFVPTRTRTHILNTRICSIAVSFFSDIDSDDGDVWASTNLSPSPPQVTPSPQSAASAAAAASSSSSSAASSVFPWAADAQTDLPAWLSRKQQVADSFAAASVMPDTSAA